TQAVFNVLAGERYKMVPNEIKDYLKGLYGKSPAPVDEEFRRSIIGDAEVIEMRPADRLEPEFEKLKAELGDLGKKHEDLLTYAILPKISHQYLERNYQLKPVTGEIINIQARYGQ